MRITLSEAAALLDKGDVVAVPTETVYGLAASISRPAAIARIFSLKGRPADNPLIVHLASADDIAAYARSTPPDFDRLAAAFWPGPMTLIAPGIEEQVPSIVRAALPTVAFRVPDHVLVRQLLVQSGPLVMPSANISGRPSSTLAAHVETDFGADFPVLDGGGCLSGLESTILHFHEGRWAIIRLGALPPEAFIPVLGYKPQVVVKKQGNLPLCPGQMYRHYAPQSRLILKRPMSFEVGCAIVGFEDRSYPQECRLFSLGSSADPERAGQLLYGVLRQLDEENIAEAWVDLDFPENGLWVTLRERLYKASGQ